MTGPDSPSRQPEASIRDLAARQHGLVTRAQLIDAGVPRHRIDYRLRCGRLLRLHQCVYRVGPIAAPREREMAAVLACGQGAVLSHRSAAGAWDLVPPAGPSVPIDVSVRGGHPVPSGVRVHRVRSLRPDEAMALDSVPVTTLPRTLLDLACVTGPGELERAVARAVREAPLDPSALDQLLKRHQGRGGTRQLRAVLDGVGGPALTRSEAELRFLALIRRAGLGVPEANVRVAGFEVDFLWRKERLIAEIDGFAYHAARDAFERDRRRDLTLAAAGWRVIRVTWDQIVNEPEALVARLAQALARMEG